MDEIFSTSMITFKVVSIDGTIDYKLSVKTIGVTLTTTLQKSTLSTISKSGVAVKRAHASKIENIKKSSGSPKTQ